MHVKITRLPSVQDLPLPQYESAGAVGFDLMVATDMEIQPGEIALVPTGLIIETPPGYALILASRSSLPRKKNLHKPHSIGVIDQDYCGPKDEIMIQVRNFSDTPTLLTRGEKIAQGLFVRVDRAEWEEVSLGDLQQKSRGGFGSTDEK